MPINSKNDTAVEVDGVIEDITSPQPPTISDNWSTSLLNSTIGELSLEQNSSALIVHINTTCTHVQEANAQLLAKARITIPAVMNYLFFNTAQIAVIYFGRKVLSNKTKIGLHEGTEDLKARLIRFLMSEIWPPLLRTDVPDESLGDEIKEQSFLTDSLQLHKEGMEQVMQNKQLQNKQDPHNRTDYNNVKSDTNFDKLKFDNSANNSEPIEPTHLTFKEEQQKMSIDHVNRNESSIVNTNSNINHIENNNNDNDDDDKKLNSIVWELAQENRWFRRSLESNMQVLLYLKRGVQGTKYLKVILNNSTHRLHFDVVSNAEEHHRWELRQLYTRLLDNLETQKGIDSYETYIRDFYEACRMAAEHSTVLEYPLQDMVHLRIHNEAKESEGQVGTHVADDSHDINNSTSKVTLNKNTGKDNDISKNEHNLYNETHHEQNQEKLEYKSAKEVKYRWMSKLRKPESATLDYKSYFSYTACELKDRCVKFMCGFLNSYHEGKLIIGVHELPRSLAEVDHQLPHEEENFDELSHSSHNNSNNKRSKAETDKFTNNKTSNNNNYLNESSSAEDESNFNSLFDSNTSDKSRQAQEHEETHRHSHNDKDNHNSSYANSSAADNNNDSSYSNHSHHHTTTSSSSFAVNATTMKSVYVHNDYVDQYVLGAHITSEELDDVQEELSRQLLNCVPPVPPRCVHIDVFQLHIPDNVWCAPSAIILYERQNTPCWRTGVVRQKSNLLLRVLFPLGLTLLPLQIPINELESILDVERTILEKISANNLSNPYKLAAYAIVSFTHQPNNDNGDDEREHEYATGETHMQDANNNYNNKGDNLYVDKHTNKTESNVDRQYQREEVVQMTPPWLALLKSVMKQHESHCVFVLTDKLRRPVFTYRAPMSILEISVNLKRCEYAPLISYRGKFFADWPSIPIWDITTRSVRRIERNYALLFHGGTPHYRKVLQHKHVDVARHVPSQNTNVHVADATSIHKLSAQEDVILSPDVFPSHTERNSFSRRTPTHESSTFHSCSVQRQWWATPQIVGRVLGFIYSREIFASVLQFRLIHPTCNRVFENVQGTHLVEMIHSTPVGAPFCAADTTYISRMQSAFITANVPVMPLLLCRVFEILGSFPSPYPYVAVPLSQQSFRVSSFLIPLFYRQHYFDGMMRLAVMLDLRDGLVKSVQLRDGNLILETVVGVGFEPLNKRQLNRLLNSSTKLSSEEKEEEKSEHVKKNVMELHDMKVNESKCESREKVDIVETLRNASTELTKNVETIATNIHNTEPVPTLNAISYKSNSKKPTSDSHVAECISNTEAISNTAMANSTKHNFLSRHPNWRRNTLRQTPSVLSNSFISPLLSNTTRVTEREIEANIPLIHFNFLTRSALESENTRSLIKVSEDMSEDNKHHTDQNDQDNTKSSKSANNTAQKNVESGDDHGNSTKHMNDINNHHSVHYQEMEMHLHTVQSNAVNNNSSIHNNNTATYTDNDNNSRSECSNALLPKTLPPWTLRHLLSWLNALLADEEHYYFFGYCERSIAFSVNDVHEMCAAHLDPSASVFVANKSVNFATSREECLLYNKVKEWCAIHGVSDC